jgi:hypothetical protein
MVQVQPLSPNLRLTDGRGLVTREGFQFLQGLRQSVSDGGFQESDPTLEALAELDGNAGILTQTGTDSFTKRALTGTANEISVSNGSGAAGNPTVSLPTALTFTGKTVTGGTFASGAFAGTFIGSIGATTPATGTFSTLTLDTGTKTATATAGAATLDKISGKITTESLTTAAGASYTLTLTNLTIVATDVVIPSVANGTNAAGTPMVVTVTPAAGSVVLVIKNDHSADAFNGTLVISFTVFK